VHKTIKQRNVTNFKPWVLPQSDTPDLTRNEYKVPKQELKICSRTIPGVLETPQRFIPIVFSLKQEVAFHVSSIGLPTENQNISGEKDFISHYLPVQKTDNTITAIARLDVPY
jgi:hypothetical protein